MKRKWPRCSLLPALCFLIIPCFSAAAASLQLPSGPLGQPDKKITFIAFTIKNPAIVLVFRRFQEAARILRWKVKFVDAGSDPEQVRQSVGLAVDGGADGIVLAGAQFPPGLKILLDKAKQKHVVVVGWHAAAEPGPSLGLFTNVTTRVDDVANAAANYVIQKSGGKAGVVLFNDNRFAVANAKTLAMQAALSKCVHCHVLTVVNMPIDRADVLLPQAVAVLNQRFGRQWNYSLAINDAYFNTMDSLLFHLHRYDLFFVSAGDGDENAQSRIHFGVSHQLASVAEPLGQQAWQLADELNRGFAGQKPSSYISRPLLLTRQSLLHFSPNSSGDDIFPEQAEYLRLWGIKLSLGHP